MRQDKNIAIKLRSDDKSYKEISRILNIPRSTLHVWFSKLGWSKKLKIKLTDEQRRLSMIRMQKMGKIISQRWLEFRERNKAEAIKEFEILKKDKLFLAGLMLYWAEGDNSNNSAARFTNTDPRMISIMIDFACKICKISKEKVRINLILYPDLVENAVKRFWSNYLGIPEKQFYKIQFIIGKHPRKKLQYGICSVNIGNLSTKIRIKTWINLYAQYFAGIV